MHGGGDSEDSPMNEAKVRCGGCGKEYSWKPEFAGKKVKCKCGEVFLFPDQPPTAVAEPEEDSIELGDLPPLPSEPPPSIRADPEPPPVITTRRADPEASDPKVCPSCYADMLATAVICLSCGYNRKTKKKIHTDTPVVRTDDVDDAAGSDGAGPAAAAGSPDSPVSKIFGMFKKKEK